MNSYRRRKIWNGWMLTLMGISAFLLIGILFGLLGYIAVQGVSAIHWDFFTQLPKPVGEAGGGMANAIVGTFKLLALAAAVGVPVGFLGGVYLSEFGRKSFLGFVVRYAADLINGIPSIVIGIFAYTVIVLPMGHFSTLAGGVALGVMMIPIALRSTEEFLKLVPHSLREAGLAPGGPQWETILPVVVPGAPPGGGARRFPYLARVAGETAPLLFTAFSNRFWSRGWLEPTASLPVMIYTYAVAPYDEWHRQAWAAGLILLLLVLGTNIIARLFLHRPGRSFG